MDRSPPNASGAASSTAPADPYDAGAAGYAAHLEPTLRGMAERLAELAEARPGRRLLDLATGTGTAARAAANRGAAVVGVDRSPGMRAIAHDLSPEVDFRLGDACALPFDPARFDAVTCGLSLSHFTDLDGALREILRVLRPGGRLVASAWSGSSPTNAVGELLDRYGAGSAGVGLDEARWGDPNLASSALGRAGFASVAVERESFTGRFANADDALAWSLAWPLTSARLAGLDPRQRDLLVSEARRALECSDPCWRFIFNFYVGRAAGP